MTKQVFTWCLLAMTAFTSKAQTIGNLNPIAGMQQEFSYANLTLADSGNVGANQTWNFANATLTGETSSKSFRALTAQEQIDFPQANLAYTMDQEPEVYFIQANTDSITELGDESMSMTNPAILYSYPITATNYLFTDDVAMSMPGFLEMTGFSTTVSQGSGTLITPFGTFENVIKLKRVAITEMTIMGQLIKTTNTTYIWVNADNKAELLLLDHTDYEDEMQEDEEYAVFLANGSALSVSDLTLEKMKITPNPIQSNIQLVGEIPVQAEYSIFSISGQKIKSGVLSVSGEIQADEMQSGTYLMTIYQNQTPIQTIRFTK